MTENMAPADAVVEASDVTEAEAAEAGWRARLRNIHAIRLGVGVLGIGGFVLGAIVAWNSDSATTLLIVSAVMLVLAALGLDWEEIRGGYGNATFRMIRRGLQDVGEQIERVAADEEIPAPARQELESLRERVDALARPRWREGAASTANIDALVREMMRTQATHAFPVGLDSVQLKLRIVPPQTDSSYRCTVKTPSGGSYEAVTRRFTTMGQNIRVGPNTYTIVYPDEFQGSEPLFPGEYEVEWRLARHADQPIHPTVASLLERATLPVARDSFTIPDRAASPPTAGAS